MTNKITDTVKDVYSNPELLQTGKDKVIDTIKTNVFDIIAIAIVVSIFLLALGALKIVDFTTSSILDMIVGFIPYYFALVLLSNNFYLKGTYKGKITKKYLNAVTAYSDITSKLDGRQLDSMHDFCDYYNNEALVKIQRAYCKSAAISFELFDVGVINDKGEVVEKPLKICTDEYIKKHYTPEQAKRIIAAKKAKVKGITENLLLSNIKSDDDTDIGKGEDDLAKQRRISTAIISFFSMLLLCMIGFKDITEWGWIAAFLILFKLVWILSRSYTKYFTGYNDIVIHLTSHLLRKYDILKQFNYWYTEKYCPQDIIKSDKILTT